MWEPATSNWAFKQPFYFQRAFLPPAFEMFKQIFAIYVAKAHQEFLTPRKTGSNHPTSKFKIRKVFDWKVPLLLTAAAYLQQLCPAPRPP